MSPRTARPGDGHTPASPFADTRYEYAERPVGFWRSLWLLFKGARLKESVTFAVSEELDSEGGVREVWAQVRV